jgi:hypothetical protein
MSSAVGMQVVRGRIIKKGRSSQTFRVTHRTFRYLSWVSLVPCPRLCVQLPVASRLAGHTGARVPPWVLASSSGGGAVGDASLGFMVDFSGSPSMSARAQRRVGSSPALATP